MFDIKEYQWQCQMSTMSNANNVKCQQCHVLSECVLIFSIFLYRETCCFNFFYSSNLSGMLSCSPHMSKVHELQIRYINFLFCKSSSAPSLFLSFPFLTVFNFILLFQYHHYCRRRWLRGLVVIHPRPWLQAKAANYCFFIIVIVTIIKQLLFQHRRHHNYQYLRRHLK